jgi:hypothetical protein
VHTGRDFIRTAFDDIRYSSGELLLSNLLWVLGCLLVVTLPPAFAGLYYATYQLAYEKKVDWHTFLEGARKYFWPSWRFALSNLLVYGGLAFNLWYTNQIGTGWAAALQVLYLAAALVWTVIQVFTFPLLLAQEQPRLTQAWRNSGVLFVKHVRFTLPLCLWLAVLTSLSVWLWPSWFLFTGCLVAYFSNLGLRYLLLREKVTKA